MTKRKMTKENRDIINFHRLANIGQLLIKISDQLDIIQAITLGTEEQKEEMRKNLEELENESRANNAEIGSTRESDGNIDNESRQVSGPDGVV